MSGLEKTEVAKSIDKMLRKRCDDYSIVRVGVDVQSMYADDYIHALANLMKGMRIPFETCEFMEMAISMHEWIWPDQFYIIGGQSRGYTISSTQRLIQIVEQCPEGPILERAKKDYHFPLDKSFKNRPSFNDFLEQVRSSNKKVLFVRNGPKYLLKGELKEIAELFLVPILDNTGGSANFSEDY